MSKIEELIKEKCREGVVYKPLNDLCTIITKQTGFDYSSTIKPVLLTEPSLNTYSFIQNKDFEGSHINLNTDYYIPISIAERYPKITLDVPSLLISLSGKVGNVGFYGLNTKAFIGGAVGICKLKEDVDGKFVMYYLMSAEGQKYLFKSVKAASHINLTVESIRETPIPIPPIEIQQEIVRILDKFTELETELQAELEARKKQYEYYRDKLLRQTTNYLTLSELAIKICSGSTPNKSHPEFYENGTVPWLRTQEVIYNEIWETECFITDYAVEKTAVKWIPENCVIIAISGASAGRCAINKIPLTTNQHCLNIQINPEKALYKYVFYCISNQIKELLEKKEGARGDLNSRRILSLSIPVPDLRTQAIIVEKLDSFNIICNDNVKGLPAEIKARHKQYEYYRDKLLTFERKEM